MSVKTIFKHMLYCYKRGRIKDTTNVQNKFTGKELTALSSLVLAPALWFWELSWLWKKEIKTASVLA